MTWHYKTTPDVTLCCLEKHQVFLFCFIRTTDKLQWYERLRFTAPGTATAGVMHYAAWHFINIFQTYQRSTLEVNTLSHTPGQSAWFAAWYQHLTIKRSQNTTTDCGRHARDQSFFDAARADALAKCKRAAVANGEWAGGTERTTCFRVPSRPRARTQPAFGR